jgi:hypothetical protein
MQSEFGLSTLGRPIVIAENGNAPVIRDVFVVVTLLLGAWVLVHVNRSVAISFQSLILRGEKTDAATQQAKSLSRAFLAVFALYNVHQVIHIALADNIARSVAYYESKWLYDKYLLSTMEITFYFNIPVSIFGARVAPKLLRGLAVAISNRTNGGETPSGEDVDPLVGQLSSGIPHLRSLSKKLLLYTSSAVMTVMHYRVESYRLYSAITTFTIAGEGLAGLALALAIWYLIVHVRGLETPEDEQPVAAKVDSKRSKRRQWSKLAQSEEPETSPDVVSAASKTTSLPPSPEDGRGESIAGTSERPTRNENATRTPSVRRRSPARA